MRKSGSKTSAMYALYTTKAMVFPIKVVVMKCVGCRKKPARILPVRRFLLLASSMPSLSAARKAVSIPEKKAERIRALIMITIW